MAGKLDVLRHSERILESDVNVLDAINGDTVDLPAVGGLWGQEAVVRGGAKFRPSGSVLRIEAERIDRADARDLSLWNAAPRPILDVLGDIENDDDIIEALDRLS